MCDRSKEFESRGEIGVLVGEGHLGLKFYVSTSKGQEEASYPQVTAIEGALGVDDHESDAPLEEGALVKLSTY